MKREYNFGNSKPAPSAARLKNRETKKNKIAFVPLEEFDKKIFSKPAYVRAFINICFEDYAYNHNLKELTDALSLVAKYAKPAQIAQKSGLSRQAVYKAVRSGSSPSFSTVFDILAAAGFGLKAVKLRNHKSAK